MSCLRAIPCLARAVLGAAFLVLPCLATSCGEGRPASPGEAAGAAGGVATRREEVAAGSPADRAMEARGNEGREQAAPSWAVADGVFLVSIEMYFPESRGTNCDQSLDHVSFPFQVDLKRAPEGVRGRAWAPLAYIPLQAVSEFAGRLENDEMISEPFALEANYRIESLELRFKQGPAGALIGEGPGVFHHFSGALGFECRGAVEVALEADDAFAGATLVTDRVVGAAPLRLWFDEPVEPDVVVRVRKDEEALAAQVELGMLDDLLVGVVLKPDTVWPPGPLTLEVEGARDIQGNTASGLAWEVMSPEWRSAAEDLSFEHPAETVEGTYDGPWHGCRKATGWRYHDSASSAALSGTPTDGALYAACFGGGQLLAGYLEPPAGAEEILIDAFRFDPTLGLALDDFTLRVVTPSGSVPLALLEGEPASEPVQETAATLWRSYAAPIEPGEAFWLIAEAPSDVPPYSWDEVSPPVLHLDNVRFR